MLYIIIRESILFIVKSMIKLYVIVPDISSGVVFNDVLNRNGITTEWKYHKIAPRVIENKLTTSKDVVRDLDKIFGTFKNRSQSVVIACNTLQLWLPEVNQEFKKNVKIYTTFEACEWKYGRQKRRPLWLGTTPLVERTEKFPTFLSIGKPDVQNMVQELIWRVKMVEGDEFGTAPEVVKADAKLSKREQREKISEVKESILNEIIKSKNKQVILGCTELPMVFDRHKMKGITFIDPAQVTAEYIKEQSVAVVLAGGTISSLPNSSGALVGGKVFNLLERLIEALPGSFNNFNITKAAVAYRGLSENMMPKDHEMVLSSIKTVIKAGVRKVVVTHGTDSMEQTARFVHKKLIKLLKRKHVPVIFTGANEHIGKVQTDAWDNLELALNSPEVTDKGGVYIAFGGKIVDGVKAVKEIFNGKWMKYVEKGSEEYLRSLRDAQKTVLKLNSSISEKLGSLKNHSRVVEYEVNQIRENHSKFRKVINSGRVKAVLFKLYHSGTANTADSKASVSKLVRELTDRGIVCFGATENHEPTALNVYETSVSLKEAGLIPLFDMVYPVALHKLNTYYSLSEDYSREDIVKLMLTDVVGEISKDVPKSFK